MLLLAAFATWYFTRPTVQLDEVDGLYSNSCCAPISLSNGVLTSGDTRATYTLAEMKFGLTANTTRELFVRGAGIVAMPSTEEGAILFSNDRRTLILVDEHQHEYRFDRR